MYKKKSLFVTFEGIEGSGKSYQSLKLYKNLTKKNIPVILTREPGGTTTGERIRAILLDIEEKEMTAMTELLLIFAARRQHIEQVIEPALASGIWVISDRFTDSSYAYQGGGRQLGEHSVAELEGYVLGDFSPDLTIILDLDVSTGLARASAGIDADRFETEQRDFFERVRQVFLDRASGDNYRVIDTSQTIDQVHAEIRQVIGAFCHEV